MKHQAKSVCTTVTNDHQCSIPNSCCIPTIAAAYIGRLASFEWWILSLSSTVIVQVHFKRISKSTHYGKGHRNVVIATASCSFICYKAIYLAVVCSVKLHNYSITVVCFCCNNRVKVKVQYIRAFSAFIHAVIVFQSLFLCRTQMVEVWYPSNWACRHTNYA